MPELMDPAHGETTPGTAAAGPVRAVVVVPTFRRPEMLTRTLASLAAQIAAARFAVVVVENDAAGLAGRAAAERAMADTGLAGEVLVEPRQGNVSAINAGFAHALAAYPDAEYLLMMDDDEIASPGWLQAMLAAADRSDADIVGGPVLSEFSPAAPAWIRPHPVFWPIAAETGPIDIIWGSGNCLIRRRGFERLGLPVFDPQFNFLGGGDMDFFVRARAAGLRFWWVSEAEISEVVPPSRTTANWVFRRGLRIGAINRRIDLKRHAGRSGALKVALKDVAILGVAPLRGLRDLLRTGNAFAALHPATIALGRIGSALGWQTEQYRAPK
jgi:GT2 family glycosyltransferase